MTLAVVAVAGTASATEKIKFDNFDATIIIGQEIYERWSLRPLTRGFAMAKVSVPGGFL